MPQSPCLSVLLLWTLLWALVLVMPLSDLFCCFGSKAGKQETDDRPAVYVDLAADRSGKAEADEEEMSRRKESPQRKKLKTEECDEAESIAVRQPPLVEKCAVVQDVEADVVDTADTVVYESGLG